MFSNCGAGKTLESRKSTLNVHSRTVAEVPILWPPDVKSQLIGKDPDAGKDWGQGKRGWQEEEMVGCHHWLNEHEPEQLQEIVKEKETRYAIVHEVAKSQTWLSDWITTTMGWVSGCRIHWEFGVNRCKLLYIELVDNKVLLYSTRNYIQCPRINHNRKEYKNECIYM